VGLLHILLLRTTVRHPLLAMAAAYPVEKAGSKELVFTTSPEDEKLGNNSIDDSQSFIPGSEGVTQHDLDTLRHVADRLPAAAWLVAIVEFAERYVVPPFLTIHQ